MSKKQPNINFGAAILFIIFSLLFFVLLYRFISIQISGEAGGQALVAKAKSLYDHEKVLEAHRGTIYDRNGEVIAEDTNSYKLIAILDEKMTTDDENPQHVVDPEKTAQKLAEVLDLKESEIYQILTREGDPFQVEFGKAGRDLTIQKKKEIEELKLPGITFIKDSKRFYPNGAFASHLIGYVEQQETDDGQTKTVGMMGLEKNLNDLLTGTDGTFSYESDIWGYLLPNGKEVVQPAVNGKDVYLTIDKKIQTFLEDAMNQVDKEYTPKQIIGIVANPKTGEILAMSQRPTFHPKTKVGINKTWQNLAIENAFEPGSTMKIFTLAAAIEDGVFDPNELFESGTYKVTDNSSPVRDHNGGRGWDMISYLEGVQRSSNVAFAKIVKEKLGYERFREYLTKFGFDKATGIDLPNETSGTILYDWPLEKVTTGFGQGSVFTPIQQIQAATAIANDGKMMKPLVVSKIVDSDKDEIVEDIKPEVAGNPISADTAKETRDILESVVSSEKGTGYNRYNIEGYEVAGKTGTAQISNPNGGGYMKGHENYVFSFLGMAPADDPELVVYVAVQQPQMDLYTNGAEPVAKIFNPVMKNSLQYLNIDPSEQPKLASNKIPNLTGLALDEATQKLTENGFEPVVIGNGSKVVEQLPSNQVTLLEGERVVIKTDGDFLMPDMNGWSLRDVMKVAKLAELELNTVGTGYVFKQNLAPGSIPKEGDYLIIELQTPEEKMNNETGAENGEINVESESLAESQDIENVQE